MLISWSKPGSPNISDRRGKVAPPFARRLLWRLLLAESLILLAGARVLVALAPFKFWRATLGRIAAPADDVPPPPGPVPGGSDRGTARARRVARGVERAAALLPFETKCLPRAVAVQWMLGLRAIPSTLAIATHARDRTGEHAFHAWVERGGQFVIGHCDRASYRALLRLSRGGDSAGPGDDASSSALPGA